jgi:hypothetical protein
MAKGFFPVSDEELPPEFPTRLELPLVLVELEMALPARVPPPYFPV